MQSDIYLPLHSQMRFLHKGKTKDHQLTNHNKYFTYWKSRYDHFPRGI